MFSGITIYLPFYIFLLFGSKSVSEAGSFFNERTTRQGLPTASESAGISRFTTLPAPITTLSPIVTPGKTDTPAPIHTSFPIVTARAYSVPLPRSSASNG